MIDWRREYLVAFILALGVFVPAAQSAEGVLPRGRSVNSRGGAVTKMPGKSFSGQLPPLTEDETALAKRLRTHVEALAGTIGERNTRHHRKLYEAARYIEGQLTTFGYKVERQRFNVKGRECENLAVEIPGVTKHAEVVVVGAHYDSAPNAAGANDNGSGVAGLLELARTFARNKPARTLRFVAFTNEEPPYFQTESMGSLVYARSIKRRGDNVVGMICLETIGYYSDKPNSQHYPSPFNMFYPSTGNFIGFVGNVPSAPLVEQIVQKFRETTKFPSEGGALPAQIEGVGFSDHWSFWQQGYPAVMVTDTAMFRYPYYHTLQDTPDKCDYARMARVMAGIDRVVAALCGSGESSPATE